MKRKLKLSKLNVESFVTSGNKADKNAILGGMPIPTDTNKYVCINYTYILGQCDIYFTKYPICEPTLQYICAQSWGTECINTNNVCATNLGKVC